MSKDTGITWRISPHNCPVTASLKSRAQAYSYNDFALALYYDTLTQKVFREPADQILKTRLAEPLSIRGSVYF